MKKILCTLLAVALLATAALALADDNVLVIYSPNSDTEVDNIIPAFEEAIPRRTTPRRMSCGAA